jgi:hypothetical protein
MQVKWKKLFLSATVWLMTEIILNFLGLDNLADYDEFIQKKRDMMESHLGSQLTQVIDFDLSAAIS